LVVDGPEGLRVRRWAADTQLNGAPVEDALLEAGDCLSLGGVELELVGPTKTVISLPSSATFSNSLAEALAEEASPELLLLEWHKEVTAADEPSVAAATPRELVEAAEFVGAELQSEGAEQIPAVSEEACCDDATLDVANGELSANATIEDGSHEDGLDGPAPLNETEAAEFVFGELQAACEVARGRNRKMLSALRNLRAEKESLVRRFENGERSTELAQERAACKAAQHRADEDQHELHIELKELRQQLGEWEGLLAENTQRMAELQQELVAARANLGTQAHVCDQVAEDEQAYTEPAIQIGESSSLPTMAEREANQDESWEPSQVDSKRYETLDSAIPSMLNDVRVAEERSPAFVDPTDNAATPATDGVTSDVPAAWELASERKLDGAATDPAAHRDERAEVGGTWDDVPAAESSSDVSPFDVNTNVQAATEKSAWQVSNEVAAENGTAERDDDLSPFAEFSIWKQGADAEKAISEEAATPREVEPSANSAFTWGSDSLQRFDDQTEAAGSQSDQQADHAAEPNPWAVSEKEREVSASTNEHATEAETAPAQSASFIDRYSHLFAEDETAAPAVIGAPPIPQAVQASSLPAVSVTPSSAVNASGSGEDESIEQYMAKLMKRVRGEDSTAALSVTAPAATPATEQSEVPTAVSASSDVPEHKDAVDLAAEAGQAQEVPSEVPVNWDAFTRRAATAPTTDLGALRALANQTARGDISRHRLKTHRRDAKTKVIVSVLAGMTSLWLMLAAPNWRDIQFITACVSLIVAAYWAGEALREMVRWMRIGHDGFGADSAEDAALPIDVI
jgi:hypothetical protein